MMFHISVVAGRVAACRFMEIAREGKKAHHQQELKMRLLEIVVK